LIRVVFLWLFFALTTAYGVEPAVPEGKVSDIVVEGTRRIEPAVVTAASGLHLGETLSPSKIRREVKKIYATGFFDDVVISTEPHESGFRVRISVIEKPSIRDVTIEGNKKIDEEDIREVLDLSAFSVLNDAEINDNISKIRDLYIEKGYYLAEVKADVRPVNDNLVNLVFVIDENRKVIVQRVEFSGNDNLPDGKIKRFLQIKEGGVAPWLTSSGTFNSDYLDADRQTVSAVFLEEGFVDVKVSEANVYLSPDKRYIFVSYQIEEGERYTVGDLDVSGDFRPEEGVTRENVLSVVNGRRVADIQEENWRAHHEKKAPMFSIETKGPKLTTGDQFKYSMIHQVMSGISELYADQGYAFVNVVPLTNPDPETKQVHITFDVSVGEKVRIGRINITGNDPTFDKVVRREIQINEGDVYRGSLIKASRSRLERLGFFEEVKIATPRGVGDNVLDMNVQVTEQPTGSFSLGLGYSNYENFVLTANVSKNNFMGLGYVMSAAINWSGLRRQGNLSFFDPYFLDSRWTLHVNGYSITREFQLNEYQRGGSLAVGRYLDPRDDIQLRMEYTIEDVGLTSLDAYRQRLLGGELYKNGLTSSLGLSLNIDKRNNRIFATQGVYFSAASTLAGGFRSGDDKLVSLLGGEFNFVENRVNLRWFQPLVPNTDLFVLRLNSTMGFIHSTDGRPIPFIHRFRAGGINSVRGYNWFSLGPTVRAFQNDDPVRADDALIVGGTQTWVNNFEIESPIIRAAGISGVVFFDAGNAFGDPWGEGNINPMDLRFSSGFGVRWRSPMGPMRFEWGFPIKPRDGERPSVFDFSIGSFF
jgi:outer membrane protein insertion porin family